MSDFPDTEICQRIQPKARIIEGRLAVPPGVPPRHLATMEDVCRAALWPSVHDGYARWRRDFRWLDGGHTLAYRIIDIPGREAL